MTRKAATDRSGKRVPPPDDDPPDDEPPDDEPPDDEPPEDDPPDDEPPEDEPPEDEPPGEVGPSLSLHPKETRERDRDTADDEKDPLVHV